MALAWLPMVHDSLARGELVEPFGPTLRWWTRYAYYLVVLAHGDGRTPRPEMAALVEFVREEAMATRHAIGEVNPENAGPTEGD